MTESERGDVQPIFIRLIECGINNLQNRGAGAEVGRICSALSSKEILI